MSNANLEVKYLPIDSLKPWDNNPKKHNSAAISDSVEEFGVMKPILVQKDTHRIIAGHGRLDAFRAAGLAEVPVIEHDIDDARAKAYALIDNQTTISGGWDGTLLELNLQDITLELPDLDMTLFGFSEKQAGKTAKEDDFDVDEALGADVEPITKPGDIIILGKHRLMCGDCTYERAVTELMDGNSPDLLLTDPPYCSGGYQEAGKGTGSIGTTKKVKIANDTLSTRGFQALLKGAIKQSSTPAAYIFTDWRMWVNLFDVVEGSGMGVRAMIVWDKGTIGLGVGWRMQHELIMYAHRLDAPHSVHGYSHGNVIQATRTGNPNHPTQKPVELIAELLKVSEYADTVYDPFAGSGTTLIACEQLGRRCYMMELEPHYCDVIVQRWEALTNEKAVRL